MYGCVPGVDVGIDAHRDARSSRESLRMQFRAASSSALLSTLKQPMSSFSAKSISAPDLPTPEKMTLRGSPPARMHAFEFAAGNDVEAGAERREQIQDREIAVGFHRIADAVRQRLQAPLRAQRIARRNGRANRHRSACRSAAAMSASGTSSRWANRRANDSASFIGRARSRVVRVRLSGKRNGPFWPQVATISSNRPAQQAQPSTKRTNCTSGTNEARKYTRCN